MKIKIGLVGLGEAVQALHMPALEQLRDRYEVTAVADASRETTDYNCRNISYSASLL